MPGVGVIGADINRPWRNIHRARKVDLLPAACGLVGKGRRGEQGSRSAPKVTYMRTGVCRTLVKADAGNLAGGCGRKLNPDFYCSCVSRDGRSRARAEEA